MDTKEKHIRENESNEKREIREERDGFENPIARGIKANGKIQKNKNTGKINRLWLWLGVIILIFILVWWLFSIGTFSDIIGTANG